MRSREIVQIFGASLYVLQENFGWIVSKTELALARHTMLETLLERLVLLQLRIYLIIASFLLANCLTQQSVGFLHFPELLFEVNELGYIDVIVLLHLTLPYHI